MKRNVYLKAGILLLSLLLLPAMVGCRAISSPLVPTVSEGDVFHTMEQIDLEFGRSRNITVEQLPNGMRATGPEGAALIEIGNRSFSLGPEGDRNEFQADILGFQVESGRYYFIIAVHLGPDSSILAVAPDPNANCPPFVPCFDSEKVGFFPGAPGSENVSVIINPALGYTEVAGLRFREEVTLNVWENGIVELDRENIAVSDINGQQWISKRVRIGEETAILLIRR